VVNETRTGFFLTFEGGEGAGKSTQVNRLKSWLEARGVSVLATREPGGTPSGERLRTLLVEDETQNWSSWSEILLMTAARVEHVRQVIKPALEAGQVVLCDRYVDSTRAYQACDEARDEAILHLHKSAVCGGLMPELTILLDLSPEQGLERAFARGGAARFEKRGLDYHRRVRSRFNLMAQDEPDRFLTLDASLDIETLHARIREPLANRLILANHDG
jgi:dTMP kinase